jgi:hypothetical protein
MTIKHYPNIVTDRIRMLIDPGNFKFYDARENLFVNSEGVGDTSWLKGNMNTIANQIPAPFGRPSGDKLVPTTTNAEHLFYQSPNLTSDIYTVSGYIKDGGYPEFFVRVDSSSTGTQVRFNVQTGEILSTINDISRKIESVGNGWYRFSVTFSNNIVNFVFMTRPINTNSFAGDGTSGVYVYGLQLERGYGPTDYIQTAASAINRPTVINDFSVNQFNTTRVNSVRYSSESGGVLVYNGSNHYMTTGKTLFGASNTFSKTFGVWAHTSGTGIQEWVSQWTSANTGNSWFFGPRSFSGGNANVFCDDSWAPVVPFELNTWIYWCIVNDVTNNNAYLYKNGVLVATRGSKLSSTGSGPLIIGRQGESNAEYFNGKMGQIHAYARALSPAEVRQNFDALRGRYGV